MIIWVGKFCFFARYNFSDLHFFCLILSHHLRKKSIFMIEWEWTGTVPQLFFVDFLDFYITLARILLSYVFLQLQKVFVTSMAHVFLANQRNLIESKHDLENQNFTVWIVRDFAGECTRQHLKARETYLPIDFHVFSVDSVNCIDYSLLFSVVSSV